MSKVESVEKIQSTRKSEHWIQWDEETFLKYELAVFAKKNKIPLEKLIRGYLSGLMEREFWWDNADPQALINIANWILDNPPNVWEKNTPGKKGGGGLTRWYIQYIGKPPRISSWNPGS